ncbi:MAG: nucleoside hydrolase [Spirochaetales bacterium]|nr:nucleoside hydrolase [Spirochaetales bacterium]
MKDAAKILIDCDPGIDDALALMLAFASDELELTGITTVAGNVGVEHTARNAAALCALAGVDVPVAAGAAGPLTGKAHTASAVHGNNGLGDIDLPPGAPLSDLNAVDFMYQALKEADGRLELIALGPLTNIARLLEQYPDSLSLIPRLTLMGGSLARGNVTPWAEFNFYADPEAADRVLRSGIEIHMYGLDVTTQALLDDQEMDRISAWSGKASQALSAMIACYSSFYRSKGIQGILLHDPLAVAGVIKPDLTGKKAFALGVHTGQDERRGQVMILDGEGMDRNVHVSLELHRDEFLRFFMSRIELVCS